MSALTEKSDTNKEETAEAATFEKAMSAAGFGLFHILLILVQVPATLGTVFETSTMSYILPVAECDLKLTLFNKGVLNAITYAGMIVSATIWGYVADTQGRKKVLVYGYLLDALCVLGSSLSQNFEMLVIFKFLGGFTVNGPGAVLFTYMTELYSAKQRPRVLMVLGMVTSIATLVLPLLAWAIFPRKWDFLLFGILRVHSWQVFLAVCGLPSLISGLTFMIFPESPQFYMSQGRNTDALLAFQKIYAFNTRKPRNTYPIKRLVEEVPNREINDISSTVYTIENKTEILKPKREHRTLSQSFKDGWQQIKPMFRKPLLGHSIHVYTMQFCILLGLNTIRLWLPQLFASIAQYEVNNNGSANLCTILEYSVNKTAARVANYKCEDQEDISITMYINNIVVSVAGLVGYCLAGFIVRALGAKRMLIYGLFISGCFGFSLFWSNSALTTLIISSVFVTVAAVSTSSLLGVVVLLFPTSLRTLVVAIVMMFGRLGALSGNMLFPVFVQIGCMPPFLMVALVLLGASVLSCFIPKEKK